MSTRTIIIISIAVVLVLTVVGVYFYRRGKKNVTLQYLPGELPGNPDSGNVTGASNDELKTLADALYGDMKGLNLFGHNYEPYQRAVLLNDSDIIRLYNAWNAIYQPDTEQTLVQYMSGERYTGFDNSPMILFQRFKKLNLK